MRLGEQLFDDKARIDDKVRVDDKTWIDDMSTYKTISNTINKRKGNNSVSTVNRNFSNDSKNSRQMGDNILTKLILGHI